MKPALLAAITITLAASTPALARDPLDADWSGDCRPDLQCWVEIRPKARGTYSVKYVAAAKSDARKVLCTATGTVRMTKQPGIFHGTFPKGQSLEVMAGSNGDVFIGETDNLPCGKPLAVNGQYFAIGD